MPVGRSVGMALRVAQSRVHIFSVGDEYVVKTWDPKHGEHWEGQPTTRSVAERVAWQCRIVAALIELGWSKLDAESVAISASAAVYPKDWGEVVHDKAKGSRLREGRPNENDKARGACPT